ncbi:mobile mystery protein B [Bdellovibrio sp. HCB2-146]|uniref:mobile mystery protein B n=1 Tax=Bdellovibrio sp. HCB2-146 TaxID=3394362 RepID=UPI0039BC51CE
MKIESPPNATPLDQDSLNGLIPGLTTQAELDEFEAAGIARATLWAMSSRRLKTDLLSASGLCLLHRKMFGDTWKWAGLFRTRETNIGVSPSRIQNDLKILLDDVHFWLQNQTFSTDEIIARFHHRLVLIHPFPNGNGRFSRLAADLLADQLECPSFSWGKANLTKAGSSRERYISALKKADTNELYHDLLNFMRS